ncbi:MAG: carbohydrate binding domain-containing protein [Lentisphaerota bacterium]
MKMINNVFIMCLMVLAINTLPALSASSASLENPVLNPSFEVAGANNLPANWTLNGAAAANLKVTRSSEKAYKGSYSVRFEDNNREDGIGLLGNQIAVAPGKKYEASGYFYVESGTANIYIEFLDEKGKRVTAESADIPAGSEWKPGKVTATAPANAKSARVNLYSSYANVGIFYADEINFCEAVSEGASAATATPANAATAVAVPALSASLENPVLNPSFEVAGANNLPANWTLNGAAAANLKVTRSSEKAYKGSYSVRFEDNNREDGIGLLGNQIAVAPGKKYEASGYFYVESGTANIYIEFLDEKGKRVTAESADIPAGSEWKPGKVTATAPANAKSARVNLYSSYANVGIFYADEINFCEAVSEGASAATATPANAASTVATATADLPLGQDWPVKAVPAYMPETELTGINEKQAQDILNVRDFGAIGDGASHPLSEVLKTQAEIDKKYGNGRYLLTDERDYVGVCEAIRYSLYYGSTRGQSNPDLLKLHERAAHMRSSNAVHVPAGLYVINRTIELIELYGFTLYGDGAPATVFYFTRPEPLFWIQRSANMKFRDFCIASNPQSRSTGFYIVDDFKKDINRNGSPAFQIVFDRLLIFKFYKGVDLAGDVMTDNEYFYSCRFLYNQIAVHQRNAQCMSVEFFGCDFQRNKYCLLVEAGGQINVHGGDFIANGTTLLLAPNKVFTKSTGGGPTINRNNGKFNFYGVRWELEEAPMFDAIDDGSLLAQVNLDNCAMYQRAAGKGTPLGIIHNGMNVVIRNLNIGPYEIKILGDTRDYSDKRKGVLILDNIVGALAYAEVNGLPTVFDGKKWNIDGNGVITESTDWKHTIKLR